MHERVDRLVGGFVEVDHELDREFEAGNGDYGEDYITSDPWVIQR